MSLKVLRFLLAAAALAAGLADAQLARPLLGRTVQSVIDELRVGEAGRERNRGKQKA